MFSFVYGENDGDGDVGVKHEDGEKNQCYLEQTSLTASCDHTSRCRLFYKHNDDDRYK